MRSSTGLDGERRHADGAVPGGVWRALAPLIITGVLAACGSTPAPLRGPILDGEASVVSQLDRDLSDAYFSDRLDVDVMAAEAQVQQLAGPKDRSASRMQQYYRARLAALRGEYAAASRLGDEALAGIDPEHRRVLEALLPLWRGLQFAQGDHTLNLAEEDLQARAASALKGMTRKSASPTSPLGRQIEALVSRGLFISVLLSVPAISPDLVGATENLTQKIAQAFCGDGRATCGAADLLAVPLMVASGQGEKGVTAAERAAAEYEARGAPDFAGAAWLAAGDAFATRSSSPFDLNFQPLNIKATMKASSGELPEEFKPLSAAQIAGARTRYAKAIAAFNAANNARGLAESAARAAYLSFAASNYAAAARAFGAASTHLLSVGNTRSAYRAAIAGIVSAAIAHEPAGPSDVVSARLSEGTLDPGLRVGAVRLLARAAQFAEEVRQDYNAELRLRERAVAESRAAAAPNLLSQQLLAQATALGRVGMDRSGLALLDEAKQLRDQLPPDNELSFMLRFETNLKLFGACIGLQNAKCAKSVSEMLLGDIQRAPARALGTIDRDAFASGMAAEHAGYIALLEQTPELVLERASESQLDDDLIDIALYRLGRRKELATRLEARGRKLLAQYPVASDVDPKTSLLRRRIRLDFDRMVSLAVKADLVPLASILMTRIEEKSKTPLFEAAWERQYVLARIAESRGNTTAALEHYQRGIGVLDGMAEHLSDERMETGLNDETWSERLEYVSFLLRRGDVRRGLLEFELFRARRFQRALLSKSNTNLERLPESVALERASAEVSELEYRVEARVNPPDPVVLEAAKQRERAANDALQRRLDARPAERGSLAQALDGIQPKLTRRPATILVYLPLGARSVVVALQPGRAAVARPIPIADFALAPAVDALHTRLSSWDEAWVDSARDLYRLLIGPVEDLLPPPENGAPHHLIVIPFGEIQKVPFQALVRDRTALVARYDVSYAPSLLSVALAGDAPLASPHSKVRAMAFNGDRLEGAEAEALQIDPEARVGPHATARAFFDLVEQRGLGFVAAHAEQDSGNPFRMFVALADGPLSLFDIQGHRMSADLVILSACQTGKSNTTNSGDSIDLATTLLGDGVGAVVVTGWQIDDRLTVPLMRDFHDALGAGGDPVRALNAVQRRSAAAGDDRAHPGTWAGFSLLSGAL